jgi:RND family efflux transporter MFP subunit
LLRQVLISLVIAIAAFVGWVFFAPGAVQTLAGYGISLPFGPSATPAEAAQPPGQQATPAAGGPRPDRQGGGGRRPGGFGGNRTPTVVTAPVTLATINDSLTVIGDGMAARSVTVTSPSGGTLDELLVAPGDVVKAGDPIGHLDALSEEIALDKAKLDAQDATNALTRTKELAKSNSVSAVALNTAQLAADQANLEMRNAQLALDRRTITTPIGGAVGLMQVTPGNYLNSNTAVTTIDDTSDILVTFWVPERYASQIHVGQPVEASPVALPGQVIAGEINAIDNRIDNTSRTLQVQARIPNASQNMRAGMSFSVTIKFPGEKFPAVDPLAIQWSADGSYVWTLAEGKTKKVMAKIIQRNSDGVLVEGALKEGDPIIVEGVLQLQEGVAVKLLGNQGGDNGDGGGAGDGKERKRPVEGRNPSTGQQPVAAQQP